MRASNGIGGDYITCDLVTGSLERIPQGGANLYPEWQVGYVDGDRFETIFKFPHLRASRVVGTWLLARRLPSDIGRSVDGAVVRQVRSRGR